jgi:hypothetical protein
MRYKPLGLWKGPLTDEQVSQAIAFGTEMAAQGEKAVHDAFLVEFNQTLQAVISVSTAFERIAVYASQQTLCSETINPAFIEIVRNNHIFETHYTLDFVSPHKLLSVLRFWSSGSDDEGRPRPFPDRRLAGFENMKLVQRVELTKGMYRQIVAFPYRDKLDNMDCYEVAVQKLLFLSGAMSRFQVLLIDYH